MSGPRTSQEWLRTCSNLGFSGLLAIRRLGFRNGNWRKLSLVDRGLFRCALWVTRVHGRVANFKLLVKILGIALKLMESPSRRIWMAGKMQAEELKRQLDSRGVFEWAPSFRCWLEERDFTLYLGLTRLYRP